MSVSVVQGAQSAAGAWQRKASLAVQSWTLTGVVVAARQLLQARAADERFFVFPNARLIFPICGTPFSPYIRDVFEFSFRLAEERAEKHSSLASTLAERRPKLERVLGAGANVEHLLENGMLSKEVVKVRRSREEATEATERLLERARAQESKRAHEVQSALSQSSRLEEEKVTLESQLRAHDPRMVHDTYDFEAALASCRTSLQAQRDSVSTLEMMPKMLGHILSYAEEYGQCKICEQPCDAGTVLRIRESSSTPNVLGAPLVTRAFGTASVGRHLSHPQLSHAHSLLPVWGATCHTTPSILATSRTPILPGCHTAGFAMCRRTHSPGAKGENMQADAQQSKLRRLREERDASERELERLGVAETRGTRLRALVAAEAPAAAAALEAARKASV